MNHEIKKSSAPASSSATGVIAVIITVVVLGSVAVFLVNQNQSNKIANPSSDKIPAGQQQGSSSMSAPLASKTIVYGVWTESNSFIKSLDLSTGAYQTL